MSTNANALPTKGALRVTAVKAASSRVDGKGRGFRPSTTEDLRRAGIDALQTEGCRHTNPPICAKNGMAGVCAFARQDGICLRPPLTWPKQFRKLTQTAKSG